MRCPLCEINIPFRRNDHNFCDCENFYFCNDTDWWVRIESITIDCQPYHSYGDEGVVIKNKNNIIMKNTGIPIDFYKRSKEEISLKIQEILIFL
jgi:hypothetical protein